MVIITRVEQESPLLGESWTLFVLVRVEFLLRSIPDGYLGTIRSRRDDRILDSIKSRVGQKSYQRGVHKGERIDGSAYFWSPSFSDEMGIRRQMKAKPVNVDGGVVLMTPRMGQDINLIPAPHLVNDGKANTVANGPTTINVQRANQLAYLKPAWQ
jgi:hypothetical protein